ncbi:sigma-70 family RNA polymerase sigma factor [Bacillus ndiopicus]|uniref:sigma-70 family RNA polymerase sigma factor n=1 Tax=Bacillus ndiopicus TaxID=1347368 RepID=UPI0005A95702|nr:sigma-70 family RNA polymerase sigma factor [Bacillus ndiopicus]
MRKRETLDDLYRQHAKSLYFYLYKMCGNPQLAEDLVQETFVRATVSLEVASAEHAKAWLFQVARHAYLDEWRKNERRQKNPIFQFFLRPKEMFSPYGIPEEQLIEKVHQDLVLDIMRRLPENYRTVLYLREEESFTYKEIAQFMKMTEEQVKITLYRARKKFEGIAQQEGERYE